MVLVIQINLKWTANVTHKTSEAKLSQKSDRLYWAQGWSPLLQAVAPKIQGNKSLSLSPAFNSHINANAHNMMC